MEEIHITNIPPDLKKDLQNIAKNMGTTMSAMLKSKIREIRDSYPEHYRKEPPKY